MQWQQDDSHDMSTAACKEMILRLRGAGVRIIYFVGGDVFLRDDLFELIAFAARIGLRTHLTVNGFTVTEDVARALASSRVASLHFSLDTLSSDFDRIRGVSDASAKVLSAIERVRANSRTRIRLGITTTIMKRTIPAVPDVVRFALSQNLTVFFNLINFSHDFFATDFSEEQYILNAAEKQALRDLVAWLKRKRVEHPRLMPRLAHLDWIPRYFEDVRQPGTPCVQTMLKVCVQANGDVRPCCSMEIAGNLQTQSPENIFTSESYLAPIRRALRKECPGCSCRYALNLDVDPLSWARELWLRIGMACRPTEGGEA